MFKNNNIGNIVFKDKYSRFNIQGFNIQGFKILRFNINFIIQGLNIQYSFIIQEFIFHD